MTISCRNPAIQPVCYYYCYSVPLPSIIAGAKNRAMSMFKAVATGQLKVLCVVFLLGHLYRLPLANPASACGSDLYVRVAVAQYFLFVATVLAFLVLLAVRMEVNIAEAEAESLAPGADAAKAAKGVASVAAGWKRAALRGKLLVAVGLSVAASVLAVVAFEDGYRYRRGCPDGSGFSPSPMAVVLMALLALLHGFFAWVAVCKD